ncbi:MAG: transcription antitermination factor NusB [Syntrophorhabdaceae bacterium]|nr:transcription antitermination factor NusB [Syntrophorhabdaceae bacterium]
MRRRKARELALRMLYQVETNRDDPESALTNYCESFPYQQDIMDYARRLLSGIKQYQDIIDTKITAACENWRLDRITYVDRNILRVGIYEMFFIPDVPPKVSIDEAIELGKKYGNEDSRIFINGVLDKVMREYYKQEASKGE